MALGSAILGSRRQHDYRRAELLPHHDPEILRRVIQRTLAGDIAVHDARRRNLHVHVVGIDVVACRTGSENDSCRVIRANIAVAAGLLWFTTNRYVCHSYRFFLMFCCCMQSLVDMRGLRR